MKHSYTLGCVCKRCTREAARRAAQSSAAPIAGPTPAQCRKWARWERERRKGYLGTTESMDAYESGRPMSDDDY